MTEDTPFRLKGRNPDVLSCIANLSNDEVFTPPEFANRMLDTLAEGWAAAHDGADIWTDSAVTFLDPCAKSGVFLREITKRLIKGLEPQIPDLQTRVDHILTRQVFGIGITQLTALLARRSLYCSKFANGPHSVATAFDSEDGNVWFERTEHSWDKGGKCIYCGASQGTLDRGDEAESHAYAFIHTENIKGRMAELFGDDMQFDVIIGNPPYQLDDGGHGQSAAPIYQHFVDQALSLEPRFACFVTPSRWMTGGKGLGPFRERMLASRRLRSIVDFPKLYEAFPGVKIRGGISYFLWERDTEGPCQFQTIWDGQETGPSASRYLNEYDVLIRRNEAIPILEKVRSFGEVTLDSQISAGKPFGFRTFFHGRKSKTGLDEPIKLYGSQKTSWIDRKTIEKNAEWVDSWKVLMTAVQGTSAAVETQFLSKPIIAEPGTACTETYLVAGLHDDREAALSLASYLSTRFLRFLVSLRKVTQHATRDVYAFVPMQTWDRIWTDEELYQKYGLTDEEISFIESMIRPMELDLFDEPAAD